MSNKGILSDKIRTPITGFLTLIFFPAAIAGVLLFLIGLCSALVMLIGFISPTEKNEHLFDAYWEAFVNPDIPGSKGLVVLLMIPLTVVFLAVILYVVRARFMPIVHRVLIPIELSVLTYCGWAYPGKINSLAVAAYYGLGGFHFFLLVVALLVVSLPVIIIFFASAHEYQTEGETIRSVIEFFTGPASDADRKRWDNNHRR